MSVKIRLKRIGAKKQPVYRFVVTESDSPRDGRFVEELGFYNPTKNPAIVKVDEEKALAWMAKGATPSDTVRSLFSQAGLMAKFDAAKRK